MKDYKIIKKAINTDLSNFIFQYFMLKRKASNFLFQNKLINPFSNLMGTWSDEQVPNTYSMYSDTVMECLLINLKDKMEKEINLKLVEMYSYARIYKNGDTLARHKDRDSCAISTTLFLGGDPWPIYLEPSGDFNKEGIKIDLNVGDMLIYRGCIMEHWREPFEGNNCAQVFLHYNEATEESLKRKYDGRPFIGALLP
jgi:hypothetical protein